MSSQEYVDFYQEILLYEDNFTTVLNLNMLLAVNLICDDSRFKEGGIASAI